MTMKITIRLLLFTVAPGLLIFAPSLTTAVIFLVAILVSYMHRLLTRRVRCFRCGHISDLKLGHYIAFARAAFVCPGCRAPSKWRRLEHL